MANYPVTEFTSGQVNVPSYKLIGLVEAHAASISVYDGDRLQNVSVSVTSSAVATYYLIVAFRLDTLGYLNHTIGVVGLNTIKIPYHVDYFIVIFPMQGTAWTPNKKYQIGDKVYPTNPITTPGYFTREIAGTSGLTEPTWNTTPGSLFNDGAVNNAWSFTSNFSKPVAINPAYCPT